MIKRKLVKVDIHNDLNEFHIQLEDILHAYISLINELVSACLRFISYQQWAKIDIL